MSEPEVFFQSFLEMEAPPAVAAVAAAPGWAPIKKEYLLAKRKREEAPASLGDQEKASSNNDAAAPKPDDAVVVPPAAAAVPKAKSKRQRKVFNRRHSLSLFKTTQTERTQRKDQSL